MNTSWTIGKKLLAAFLSIAVVTLMLGCVGYFGAVKSDATLQEIFAVRLPGVDAILTIESALENIRGTVLTLAVPGLPPETRREQSKNLEHAREIYRAAWAIYEPLPKTREEAAVWQQFAPAVDAWRIENNKALELSRRFEECGMPDPAGVKASLETFRGDHFQMRSQLLEMIRTGRIVESGETHADGDLGQWSQSFQTDNPLLRQQIQQLADPHERLQESVRRTKELMRSGNAADAHAVYEKQITPLAEQVVDGLRGLAARADQALALLEQAERQVLGPVADRQREALAHLGRIVAINRRAAQEKVAGAAFVKTLSLSAMLAGVALALVLGSVIGRSINKTLRRIAVALGRGSAQTAGAAVQVSSASQSLAQGAGEQAASIEEAAASIQELTSLARRNSDGARRASELAGSAADSTKDGLTAMQRMSHAIDEIKKSSDATAKIVGTIDEIAFQTNLLALNAAVEAARAGEAGKGFAVVAEEVRNLAQRSADAAKSTARMIEESVQNSANGVLASRDVGVALQAIGDTAGELNTLVGGIAAASTEQTDGIDQINQAISRMDAVTQASAASAEQSASASEELAAQADELSALVQELLALVGGDLDRAERATKAAVKPWAIPVSCAGPANAKRTQSQEVIPLAEEELAVL
ncbi:MAG: methyl-accepting chemotaxis protein [Candidatus Krumholzibacteria bacterium]|jgi:methyl-accepting chemotaxis protein|nr:methyl-accepting chemotaxis protein [Candidatus Krumholzibacteria bacterium]